MRQVNKFYIFISVLLIILVTILIVSIRASIASYMVSNELEQGERLVRVERQKLEEVYDWSFDREDVSLIIRPSVSTEDVQEQEQDN